MQRRTRLTAAANEPVTDMDSHLIPIDGIAMNTELQKQLLRDLERAFVDRAAREQEIRTEYHATSREIQASDEEFQEQESVRYQANLESARLDYENVRRQLQNEFDEQIRAAESEYGQTVRETNRNYENAIAAVSSKYRETQWLADSVFDDQAEGSPKQRFESYQTQLGKAKEAHAAEMRQLDEMLRDARRNLDACRMGQDATEPTEVRCSTDLTQLQRQFSDAAGQASLLFQEFRRLWLPRLFRGLRPLCLFTLMWLSLSAAVLAIRSSPALLINDPGSVDWPWFAVSMAIAAGSSLLVYLVLHGWARSVAHEVFSELWQAVTEAHTAYHRWLKLSEEELNRRREATEQWALQADSRRQKANSLAVKTRDEQTQAIEEEKVKRLLEANRVHRPQINWLYAESERILKQAEQVYASRQRELVADHTHQTEQHRQEMTRRTEECEQKQHADWQQLSDRWFSEIDRITSAFEGMDKAMRSTFPPLADLHAENLVPAVSAPPFLAVGHYDVDLSQLAGGLPTDERLLLPRTQCRLPAFLPFPENPSLLLETGSEGRREAVNVLQGTMLRLLTSLPPGGARFTVIDPVGLGENFSAFMHLADFDEQLINSRIWTDASNIEQRLKDLTAHMETIFQTYLRSEFDTIQEYNRQAGEVAEPYRFLVVANFPHNFTDQAAKSLLSIAHSGARCGVYLLMSVDSKQPLPPNFPYDEIKRNAEFFRYEHGRFVNLDEDLRKLPLEFETPARAQQTIDLIRRVGELSQQTRRVEVAFERIVPPDETWWTGSTRDGIDIPLGRAGATKLQHLRLGRGTSQHVLIAGRTGSGKSSFLHALICNAALHYSPDEIEFYLVDFKKGVEFKTYASHHLPHARIVAIESDREFGVSVLQRLDSILKERADLFRAAGTQDLAQYRTARPDETLPRILLVVDEFQEFFVEDDPLSQDAALLLDRLIRQGRAFGVHVLLGSQTLAGAYSIARSTLGQIGVRIALQCGDADAHLILSEDNTAARLLTRPGEAIYNDANGLVEGNHPFQIAWLPDSERDVYLSHLTQQAQAAHRHDPEPIVFEGNVPADPRRNQTLMASLCGGGAPVTDSRQSRGEQIAWLGEAVQIKEPTSVTFRQQGGNNLMMVGQEPSAAIGIVASLMLGVGQTSAGIRDGTAGRMAQFYVLDGSHDDRGQETATVWQGLGDVLANPLRIETPTTAAEVVAQLHAELQQRLDTPSVSTEPRYLVVYNLGRFRDLRRSEDDFGFGSYDADKTPSTAQQFVTLLKEGPTVGIHTIIWSDTYNTVSRWISSQTLREFELRIAFPLSATDSSQFIESPIASRLGPNRALLYHEDSGLLEKFRPYAPPSADWLQELQDRESTSAATR